MECINIKTAEQDTCSVKHIIESGKLTVKFQQIISVSRKMVIGVEGLIRGTFPDSGESINADTLFRLAKEEKVSLELDRACREKILGEFNRVYDYDREKLLFINLDSTILEHSVGSGYLLNQVKKNKIDPSNIVIEISEKNVQNDVTLKRFVDAYKQYGFMVALDDVGTGFSNMDRILLVKPDIIKIDYSLIRNIHTDFYKQGIFKSLVILANKIGALVIAEGVESEDEAIQVLRLGGHMIQGFYLSIPAEIEEESSFYSNDKIDLLSNKFKKYINLQYAQKRNKYKELNKIVKESIGTLTEKNCEEFDSSLKEIVSDCEKMECAYILDGSGIQISQTICSNDEKSKRDNRFFYSAKKGTDHSIEKYYYPLTSTKRKRYTTEPYISLATGNLCVTISAVFESNDNKPCIFCADFITDEDAYNIEVRSPNVHAPVRVKSDIAGIIFKINDEMFTDCLTGAYNRRYMKDKLAEDLKTGQPLSIILGDIDLFKEVNDRFGHLAGDDVLKEFVSITKQCIRKDNDWIARYGGDEFLIALVNANETVAERVMEKIRCRCEKTPVIYEDAEIHFTVSLGTYTSHSPSTTLEKIIGLADKNLYAAKNSGRNKSINAGGRSESFLIT
ncbi:MAG: EAL domain-containing protein [Bacillota bacterium]|nr:EAL domain-containing protein [Bacillota bacterium]